MKLYMVAIGGKFKKANIEVHDVIFTIGDNFEETLDQIRQQWFGDKESLHVDAYQEVKGVDRYALSIKETPQESGKEVFLVYLGGHVDELIEERHQLFLVAGDSISQVRTIVSDKYFGKYSKEHFDVVKPLNACLDNTSLNKTFIHLTETINTYSLKPDWFGYMRLG